LRPKHNLHITSRQTKTKIIFKYLHTIT